MDKNLQRILALYGARLHATFVHYTSSSSSSSSSEPSSLSLSSLSLHRTSSASLPPSSASSSSSGLMSIKQFQAFVTDTGLLDGSLPMELALSAFVLSQRRLQDSAIDLGHEAVFAEFCEVVARLAEHKYQDLPLSHKLILLLHYLFPSGMALRVVSMPEQPISSVPKLDTGKKSVRITTPSASTDRLTTSRTAANSKPVSARR